MIAGFKDRGTEDVYDGQDSRAARKTCPIELWDVARRKLDMIEAAVHLHDLRVPPANRLKKLSRDRAAQYSIRINEQYRVCFTWTSLGADDVQIVDYH